jgi:cholesterol oxidase
VYNPVPIDKYAGILDLVEGKGINVLNGAGVGGGSLVYAASTYQPTKELFYKVFPRSVSYDELDRIYFPRVRKILKPSPLPEDILNTSYYQSTRVFLEQAAKANLQTRLLDINVDWDIVRKEIAGTRRPSTITGESWYGINSGAKNSLDRNYLARAEATGNVEILPLHIVKSISEIARTRGGYRVVCDQINEFGQIIAQRSFLCRHLFLAAGSLGTAKLLLQAKATGGLPRLSPQVGKYWGTNGNSLGVRAGLPPTNPTQGGPSTAAVEHFDNPIAPTVLVAAPFFGFPEGTLGSLGLNISKPEGQIAYNSSTQDTEVTWPSTSPSNQTNLKAVAHTFNLIDTANQTPTSRPKTRVRQGSFPSGKSSRTRGVQPNVIVGIDVANTVAPLGGAVMGKVCDSYGRVFGYRGLYVVDGALIPGSAACSTPSLTIAALAERCMDRILRDMRQHR